MGDEEEDAIMSDINTTPLVDIMLVLLIIFLITIPAIVHSVAVELPERKERRDSHQTGEHPDLGGQGRRCSIGVTRNLPTWMPCSTSSRWKRENPQPEVHIRGGCWRGMSRSVAWFTPASAQHFEEGVGFITEPPPRS